MTSLGLLSEIVLQRSVMPRSSTKRVVFIGNCNAFDLASAFSEIEGLKDHLEFQHVALHVTPVPTPEVRQMLDTADTVFVQGIAEAEKFRVDFVPNSVRCIGYPNLMRRAFWPFDIFVYGKDKIAEDEAAKAGHIRFPDGLLGRLRSEIPNPEERFEAYRDLNVGGINKNFIRLLEMEDDMLMQIDSLYGSKLGHFVRDSAKTDQLFHWVGHPSGLLYAALMSYCCDMLKILNVTPQPSKLDGWSAMQVPIHPRVADQLQLEWAPHNRVYRYTPFGDVTWEQYVKNYIEILG